MEFNFFNWLRNGVKKSVLLGVSDAMEEIGTPDKDDELQKRIQAAVAIESRKTPAKSPRRLGRSLKDLNQDDLPRKN